MSGWVEEGHAREWGDWRATRVSMWAGRMRATPERKKGRGARRCSPFLHHSSIFLQCPWNCRAERKSRPVSAASEKKESRITDTRVRLQRAKELMPSLDLSLREATIRPEALAAGSWPPDYTLSDHGMVTCRYELRTR